MSKEQPLFEKADLISAIELSFQNYRESGARSPKKLIPIHGYFASILSKIFGNKYEILYMGKNSKELTVQGKYYPKDIDITVTRNNIPVFCLGIKFVTSNYKQNANNYFEAMMGETANIQTCCIPYAHLIIFRVRTPYYEKNGKIKKIEIINDKDVQKYLNLQFDNSQAHRPNYLGIQIVDINEKIGKVELIGASSDLSPSIVKLLDDNLSLEKFFKEIKSFKNYLEAKDG
jgi:hypothetical protein